MCWAIVLLSFFPAQQVEEMDFLLTKIQDVAVETKEAAPKPLSFWYKQKPMILTFAYSRCPGVCNPYLTQIREYLALQGVTEEKFQMMVLSVDSSDNTDQLRKLAGFDNDFQPPANWTFAVLQEESKKKLLPALGFQMQPAGDVYDHNTVLVLVGTDGRVHQWIEGIPTSTQWNRLLKELVNEFVPVYPSLSDNVWSRCFEYDPSSGTWRMNWGLLIILMPSTLTVLILMMVQLITNRERQKRSPFVIQQ